MLSSRSRSVLRHARGRVGESLAEAARTSMARGRRAAADAGRRAVARGVPEGRSARLEYGAVLDGHTLNLSVHPPTGTDLAEPGLTGEFVLESGQRRRALPAEIVTGARQGVEGVALLGAAIGGLDLPVGRWRLSLVLTSPVRGTLVLPVRGMRTAPGPTGPTLAQNLCPLTGAYHRFGLSPTGRARLDVGAPTPTAELVLGLLSLASGTLIVDVVGANAPLEWIEAVCEDDESAVRCPVLTVAREPAAPPPPPNQVSVSVPLAEMCRTGRAAERTWSFVAVLADGSRLRVARQLHGLRQPLKVFSAQQSHLYLGPGLSVHARTSYTRRGTFEVFLRSRTGARTAPRPSVRPEGQSKP